jgi:1-pyrroline-5-carboxylate dehydrogenase
MGNLGRRDQRRPLLAPYRTEPYSDFTDSAVAAAYRAALEEARRSLGRDAPVVIGGSAVATDTTIESVNPARPGEVVGVAGAASAAIAEAALSAAWEAFPDWAATPAERRAEIVHAIGDRMHDRKMEIAAWMTLEAGKNYAESEADVAEAIDFCRYYAHEALRLAAPVEVHEYPGESNESFLLPLGAGVAIPPWNFPVAILVGMTVGPVAAGNTVVLKPASNTPVLGSLFMEAVAEAGVPPGVINFVPGPGGEIGDMLVEHPRTRFINFTGSKEVGLRIAERSAIVHPGQSWLKRSFMEMGGKDAIVVDETADLDAAADGVVRSAYGFQGQKCSACSRLIAVDAVHDELLDMVVARTEALPIGDPAENHPVGPVISAAQHRSVLAEIEAGRSEAQLVTGGEALDLDGGYYIRPTVFSGVDPKARLAQHEIFGPVLSVIRAADFDDALAIANNTEFGLTGGLYSSDPERIARARGEFHVGNLYINRKITGALVGIQPFGGFKLSGSNAKAGGPDYLRLFMEMKSVATAE